MTTMVIAALVYFGLVVGFLCLFWAAHSADHDWKQGLFVRRIRRRLTPADEGACHRLLKLFRNRNEP